MTPSELHRATGDRAMAVKDYMSAQNAYAHALAIDRTDYKSMANISMVLMQTNRIDVAIATAKRAVELSPEHAGLWSNLGYFLGIAGRWTECEAALLESIERGETFFTWHSLGLCYYSQGRFAESVKALDEALRIEPGNMEAIDKRSISMLGEGRYVEGLIDNKVRWECVACHPFMHSSVPEWHGESLRGKTISVLHEQGLGDTFQFSRFIPELRKLGAARVILSVPSGAVELFRGCDLADEVTGIQDEPSCGYGAIDYKSPTMTVPALIGASIDWLLARPHPYIQAPVHDLLLPQTGRLKVGIVWAGKPMYAQDQWRSIANPTTLLPIASLPCIDCYSVQVGERVPQLWQTGMNAFVTDLSPQIQNWADTAKLLSELDLLVSVDTAPPHLAAAMGVPVAMMLPEASCWRWLGHDTTTTPWYPSMRLFRQERQGEWGPVVKAIAEELQSGAWPAN